MEATEAAFLGILLVVYFVFLSIVLAYAVVGYVLGSKSLYAIAARRGIKNPWMAWIPVVGNWTLGCISDQYQQRKYGQDPNLRKKLLIFSIITQSGVTFFPTIGSVSVNFDLGDFGGPDGELIAPEGLIGTQLPEVLKIVLVVFMVLVMVLAIAALVLSIIQTVYQYKAYYSLYASCKPKMAIAFLLLSIFTPAGPFLLFACRNSDDGLPPEEAPASEPQQ